jgi:beta-1,4-mannosyl-glycoprotein beta-1,4-N-acetylglucosaminyltransferase
MRVFDGVLYNGEADVLECRLTELSQVVDKFVIVEGDKSFTGIPRVRDSRERFAVWADKIHWVDVETPVDSYAWNVEQAVRNRLVDEFKSLGVEADDVVTVCDVDEIWSPSMLESFAKAWHAVMMRHLIFSVHWEGPLELTCIAGPFGLIHDTADQMRRVHRDSMPKIAGGWHLGWMGGQQRCVDKLRQFSHQEYNKGDIEAMIADCFRMGTFIEGTVLDERLVTADWPRWIVSGLHPKSWRTRR